MRIPRLSTQMFGSQLARQLFAVFVLAALLPLAASDWLSSTAVNDMARQLYRQNQERTTRQVSRQVFDRLLTAKELLRALPAAPPRPGAPPPGLGRIFSALSLMAGQGQPVWTSSTGATLAQRWQTATPRVPPIQPTVDSGVDAAVVLLRTQVEANASSRVYLATLPQGRVGWIAEVNPDFLWGPVQDAEETDSTWAVTNANGVPLFQVVAPAPADAPTAPASSFRASLFLGGEFGTPDWVFSQRAPPPRAHWLGWPLSTWLGLVAAATLLLIGLLALRQIRRTLVPLNQLTAGTHQLAAGQLSARVSIAGKDEFATLATAFNTMAARIGGQFQALQGLAAIDRDILAGASDEGMARRVLDQLQLLYPQSRSVVLWQSDETTMRCATLWPTPDAQDRLLDISDVTCPASDGQAWATLQHDQTWSLDDLSTVQQAAPGHAACLLRLIPLGITHASVFPLWRHDTLRALIVVGSMQRAERGELQGAADLRDRWAVALAAHDRERELVHQATHDSLTGLLNRQGLHQALDRLLSSRPELPSLALLYIDLDHFKEVNDSRGHATGDVLLRQVSERLWQQVGGDALIARQGGDEFTLVLPGVDAAAASAIAQRTISALALSFDLPGGSFQVGASVGIALYPQHGRDRDELMRCADIALYAAKAAGRGRVQPFTIDLDAHTREQAALLADLRRAVACQEFVAYYQPRVRAVDGAITSAEALIRWQHPQRGLLYPDAFIGAAEASGLIEPIGHLMLDAACRQVADWRRKGLDLPQVSVNVSPLQLRSGSLVGQVRDALAGNGLAPTRLELEITESLLVDDDANVRSQLAALRDMGVSIAIDDFGTGFSSMAALRRLPIDVMKIDRSFVMDLETEASALPTIRAIVALAQAAQLHLVAEGVETETQARMLRELGCHELQGYLYSRPVAAAAFEQLPGLPHTPADR